MSKKFSLGVVGFVALLAVLATVCLFSLLGGPVNNDASPTLGQPASPAVIMEVLDPTLDRFAPLWKKEIGRRFDNAVGVLCHGGDFVRGEWIVASQGIGSRHVEHAQDLVRRMQALYPGRTIVLLACNTGHLELGIPGVYYAKSSVWCVPDRSVSAGDPLSRVTLDDEEADPEAAPVAAPPRSDIDPDPVGSIFEFVN